MCRGYRKGSFTSGALARRKAALPQVLVLQPRNTRTHTAHTTHTHTNAHTNAHPNLQGGWGGGEKDLSESQGWSQSQSGMIQDSMLVFGCVCMCVRVCVGLQRRCMHVSERESVCVWVSCSA